MDNFYYYIDKYVMEHCVEKIGQQLHLHVHEKCTDRDIDGSDGVFFSFF